MIIWVAFAVMTGAVVLAVLWPLSRSGNAPGISLNEDKAFYQAQITDIERDLERGLIHPTEAEAVKAEAARRLLRNFASSYPLDQESEPALRRRRAASALALSLIPLLSLAFYGAYGSPYLPGQPLASRLKADPASFGLAEAVARIEAHLARNPQDGRGWDVLGPIYMQAERYEDATRAFEIALQRLGETPQRLSNYGEALVSLKSGVVPVEAKGVFERALELDPHQPKAAYYVALSLEQDGNISEARKRYEAILDHAPSDATWAGPIKARLERLRAGETP